MTRIERFEDIQAWQKARELVTEVYKATAESEEFRKDFGLRDQIRRASVSIMSNIAEGFSRQTDKEFYDQVGRRAPGGKRASYVWHGNSKGKTG